MITYKVTEGSVLVRRIASASSNIVNVIPTGGKIYVIGEEAGWLRTNSGYYVFKTDNLEIDNPKVDTSNKMLGTIALKANNTTLPPGQVEALPGSVVVASGGGTYSGDTITKTKTAEEESASTATPISDYDKSTTTDPETEREDKISLNHQGQYANPQKVAAWNEDGTLKTDENGDLVMIDPPNGIGDASYSKNLVVTRSMEVNGKIYMIATDEKAGGEYVLPTDGNCRYSTTDGSGTTTYASDYEREQQEAQEQSTLEQILSLGSSLITAYTEMNELHVEDSRMIHGMPYQFMPIVDPRSSSGDPIGSFAKFGRKFQEKIVARAPILYLQAGLPIFMRGYSDEAKAGMLESLWTQIEASSETELRKLLDDQNTQYYSFDEQSTLYFKAVNSACTALAHLLQIEAVQIPTLSTDHDSSWGQTISEFLNPKSLGYVNWNLRTTHQLGYYGGAVAFYINSESQIQESFINSTRQSELAGKINQVSDQAMEAAFLAGGLAGSLDNKGFSTIGSMMNFQQQWNRDATKGNESSGDGALGLLSSLVNNVTNLIAGGKMVFPDIWSDSQFQRAYNVTIKLDSPESDTVSIFLNVLVPLVHILGFVLPRSAGPNMYVNPFLVRAFYKSMFHIDMGMITSCQITKGDQGAWNADGLPCQVTVELTIKDLYSSLSQASGEGSNTLISNPAQLEYLANLAGVNVAPASFMRSLELWMAVKGANRIKQGFVGSSIEMMQKVFKGIQNISSAERWRM